MAGVVRDVKYGSNRASSRVPSSATGSGNSVVVYLHSGFRGTSQAIAVGVPNLGLVEGPCPHGGSDDSAPSLTWDDCVSSIKVMSGWAATIYRDRDFKGPSLEITGDAPDLSAVAGQCKGSLNDCVSSLKVYRR